MGTLNKIIELLNTTNRQQKELTDYLGLEKSTFSAWKSGKSASYKKYLPEIASFFSVSVDELICASNAQNEKIEDSESTNPDIRMIARAGKKMTPEQAQILRKYAQFMFPEAFEYD